MLRSPSLPYGDSSSLDPLAPSEDERETAATRRSSSPAKRLPSSPLKSSRNIKKSNGQSTPEPKTYNDRSIFNPVSPSRTVTEQTLSPWKIRVTVEAEPEDEQGPGRTMTRTMKIPLRQTSSPVPEDNGRTRGRKVQSSPPKKKRSGTPVRRRSASRSRRQSVTDLDVRPLGDDNDSDEWTGRKKPQRKQSGGRGRRSQSVRSEANDTGPNEEEKVSNAASRRPRAARSSAFEIREDEDIADEAVVVSGVDSPELREIDLNRVSVRPRSQSVKRKEVDTELALQEDTAKSVPSKSTESARKISANSTMSYPTPSPTSSYHGSSDEQQGKDAEQPEDNVGFDTIMESEGFTMIDLDTIPSARQYLSSPNEDNGVTPATKNEPPAQISEPKQATKTTPREASQPVSRAKPSPIPSRLLPADDSSEISSYVASSPPAASQSLLAVPVQRPSVQQRKVTPEPYSSPKLPSPPLQNRKSSCAEDQQRTAPEEVVNAGLVLQGAVNRDASGAEFLQPKSVRRVVGSARRQFFEGFSSGTKRELRAGLRFGEELAKRQKSSPLSRQPGQEGHSVLGAASRNEESGIQPRPNTSTQVWRGEMAAEHNPFTKLSVTEAEDSGGNSVSRKTADPPFPSRNLDEIEHLSSTRSSETRTPQNSSFTMERGVLSTQARREREWQLEREAVSREIESASPSKVIVIDCEADKEIVEAHRSSLSKQETPESKASQVTREHHGANQTRPQSRRRGQLPSEQETPIPREGQEAPQEEQDLSENENDDIWLQEAQNNSSSPREESNDLFTQSEQGHQRERAAEVVHKPRRSIIPSPWKRGETFAEASTFLSHGDMSGMLWKPEKDIKFGTGAITRQKRSTRRSFDLDTMLASPVKLAATGQRNLSLRTEKHHSSESDEGYGGSVSEDEKEDPKLTQDAFGDAAGEVSQSEHSCLTENESVPSSPPAIQKIPVKFNDSTLSQHTTPPPLSRSSPAEAAEDRPSTPRSALKGTRQSFGEDESNSPVRKVVFSERSMYLNDDGEESSMSAKLDSPQSKEEDSVNDSANSQLEHETEVQQNRREKDGWLGWLWRGQPDSSGIESSTSTSKLDGGEEAVDEEQQWTTTRIAIPSAQPQNSEPRTRKSSKSKDKTPSYLLPPSYPSDPTRDPTVPLATSGAFTDSHFRTLHIIHLKSFQPRFHAPKQIRSELRQMLGWTMTVDENAAGLGEFEWKAGEVEIEVLERFMQEVEEGWEQAGQECSWGWSVEELARWLGMLVIGDVVRKEEGQRV